MHPLASEASGCLHAPNSYSTAAVGWARSEEAVPLEAAAVAWEPLVRRPLDEVRTAGPVGVTTDSGRS